MTPMKRLTISLDGELADMMADLKKDRFYDRSYAEMVRYLLRAGFLMIDERSGYRGMRVKED